MVLLHEQKTRPTFCDRCKARDRYDLPGILRGIPHLASGDFSLDNTDVLFLGDPEHRPEAHKNGRAAVHRRNRDILPFALLLGHVEIMVRRCFNVELRQKLKRYSLRRGLNVRARA